MHLLTSCKCLFYVIRKSSRTNEKRKMLKICETGKRRNTNKPVTSILFVLSIISLTFISKRVQKRFFYDFYHSSCPDLLEKQWITRDLAESIDTCQSYLLMVFPPLCLLHKMLLALVSALAYLYFSRAAHASAYTIFIRTAYIDEK